MVYLRDVFKEVSPVRTFYNVGIKKGIVNNLSNIEIKKFGKIFTVKWFINLWGDILRQAWKWIGFFQAMNSFIMESIERYSFINILKYKYLQNRNNNIDNNLERDEVIKWVFFSFLFWKNVYNNKRIEKNDIDSFFLNYDIDDIFINLNSLLNLKKDNFYKRLDNWLYYFFNISDGVAAWNSINEAILHWLFEIIERYSTKLFIESSEKEIEVSEIRNINSLSIKDFLKKRYDIDLEELGLRPKVLEITIRDIDIKTYIFALINRYDHVILGRGAHFYSYVAFIRSLTEAFQIFNSSFVNFRDINRSLWFSRWDGFSRFFGSYIEKKILYDGYKKKDIEFLQTRKYSVKVLLKIIGRRLGNKLKKWIFVKNITYNFYNIPVVIVRIPEYWLNWYQKYINVYKSYNMINFKYLLQYDLTGIIYFLNNEILLEKWFDDMVYLYRRMLKILINFNSDLISIKERFVSLFNRQISCYDEDIFTKSFCDYLDNIRIENEIFRKDIYSFVWFSLNINKMLNGSLEISDLFKIINLLGDIWLLWYLKNFLLNLKMNDLLVNFIEKKMRKSLLKLRFLKEINNEFYNFIFHYNEGNR